MHLLAAHVALHSIWFNVSLCLPSCMPACRSGLRGAVGLSLSLFVYLDTSISNEQFRVLTFFYMGAQAFLTLCLQGTSMAYILRVRSLPPS